MTMLPTVDCAIFGVLALAWLYLGYRIVLLLEKLVGIYGQRKETSAVWPSGSIASASSQISQVAEKISRSTDIRVPEIPPEAILRGPVKSAGFGNPGNGNKQQESTGVEGGDGAANQPASSACPSGRKL